MMSFNDQDRSGGCHPEPIRFAQGKLREGSGSMGAEMLRCTQHDIPISMTFPILVVKFHYERYMTTNHGAG